METHRGVEDRPMYAVETAGDARVVLLTLPAHLDPVEFDRLQDDVLKAIDGAEVGWIIDLSGTDYLGSAMLGLLVNVRHRIKRTGGTLVLCGLSPRLNEIFHACSLERLFVIRRTRAEAQRVL